MTPYEDGVTAFGIGAELCDNPHPVGSPESVAWMHGWAHASSDATLTKMWSIPGPPLYLKE